MRLLPILNSELRQMMIQMFREHIIPFLSSEFSERKRLLAVKGCSSQLLGFLDKTDQSFLFIIEVLSSFNDELWCCRPVFRVRFFTYHFRFHKSFQNKFCNGSRFFMFFRFVYHF